MAAPPALACSSRLASLLGCRLALALGPFGNGLSSVPLAAAVAAAGGLGSYGCNNLDGGGISRVAAQLREAAPPGCGHPLPFNLNLWVPLPGETAAAAAFAQRERFEGALRPLEPLYASLGVPLPPAPPPRFAPDFDEQVSAVLAAAPKVASFAFGTPPQSALDAFRAAGVTTMGSCTSVAEADALSAAGVDVVVASGWEAGGHRASWLTDPRASAGTLALLPQVAAALEHRAAALTTRRPALLAAGGVACGRSAAACLALGADGVVIGSALLACHESAAPEAHKAALASWDGPTILTDAVSGRLARGFRTSLVDILEAAVSPHHPPPPYPVQNWMTLPVRRAAAGRGDARRMNFWASQASGRCRRLPAADLVADVVAEAEEAIAGLKRERAAVRSIVPPKFVHSLRAFPYCRFTRYRHAVARSLQRGRGCAAARRRVLGLRRHGHAQRDRLQRVQHRQRHPQLRAQPDLEAQSYLFNVFGTGLNATDLGIGGVAATGAFKANLSPAVMDFALELAATELKHVQFLRAALGACAVPAPPIDLSSTTFGTIVNVALNTSGNFLNFDPANNDIAFLMSVFVYEDVGVTAYNYAAGLLSSYGLINAASSIMSAEAYHSGAVRSLLIGLQDQYAGMGLGKTVANIANGISALRAALGAGGDVGIRVPFPLSLAGVAEPSLSKAGLAVEVAPLQAANGLAFSRTPAQVKAIVTAGSPNATGLFFPMGLNRQVGAPF